MYWIAAIWLGLLLLFLVIESNTVELISVWFSLGALAALIADLCGAKLWLQIILFLAVSAGSLACLRPLVCKLVKPKVVATNVDAIIGSTGYVTGDIDNESAQGQVKLGAMEWTARSTTGGKISTGTLVKVDKIEGVKVFVSTVEQS